MVLGIVNYLEQFFANLAGEVVVFVAAVAN